MTPDVIYEISVAQKPFLSLRYSRIHSIPESSLDSFSITGPENCITCVYNDVFDLTELIRAITISIDFSSQDEAIEYISELYKEHGDDDDMLATSLLDPSSEDDDLGSYADIAEFDEAGRSGRIEIPEDLEL